MKLNLPADWQTDDWYGFVRHHFTFEGCNAWIVEPRYPAGDGRWSWCTVWPEAFVRRVGIVALLEHGFYHVHIDTYSYRANPQGLTIMKHFQDYLINMGLSAKANLIGMSWGGFFALRYAETYPDCIAAIYLDAPLCNAADPDTLQKPAHQERTTYLLSCFNMTFEEMTVSKLNPINNVKPLVEARIPMFAAVGLTDQSVELSTNFDLLEQQILAHGGTIHVERRAYWGHHPHGLDDVTPLLDFHCAARN